MSPIIPICCTFPRATCHATVCTRINLCFRYNKRYLTDHLFLRKCSVTSKDHMHLLKCLIFFHVQCSASLSLWLAVIFMEL